MTTLTRNKPRTLQTDSNNALPVAAATRIFEGSAVGIASDVARPLVSGDVFAGFASRHADNSAGAAGAERVGLVTAGHVQLVVDGVVSTSVGVPVYATDDDTFTLTADGSQIGLVQRVVSDGVAIVLFSALASALTPAEVASTRALVSAPWNQQPVSFDAALSRVCVFGQFQDGGYLCTDQAAANGNYARRLFKLTGDPTGSYTTTVFSQTAVFSNLKNTLGTNVFHVDNGIQNAWVAANGDVFFLWKSSTSTFHVHRAKAGTWTVGTDAGYSNFQACIDVGRYGATHHSGIRVANARGFLDFVNSAGQRTILLADYNLNQTRDFNGDAATGDASVVWISTDGGATFSVFLEFASGGPGTHLIDHFHGVVRDPYTGSIYFMTGDAGSENAIIQWDGVSAAPAANSSFATIAATPGWRVRSGSETLRYTDLLFAPTCIYSIPDCDEEDAETSSTGFASYVIDKNLGWVGMTAPVERMAKIPPVTAVRANGWSAVISFSGVLAAERYFHVWTIDGNPEAGASWTLVAKLKTHASVGTYPAAVPQHSFVDAAGDLWVSGVIGHGVQFSPESQSASSVRMRPVARRGAADIYDLT